MSGALQILCHLIFPFQSCEVVYININIYSSLEEAGANPHGWLWRVQDSIKEEAADAIETAQELKLEVEPEDVTALLQSQGKTLTEEELLLTDEQRKPFLGMEFASGEDAMKIIEWQQRM